MYMYLFVYNILQSNLLAGGQVRVRSAGVLHIRRTPALKSSHVFSFLMHLKNNFTRICVLLSLTDSLPTARARERVNHGQLFCVSIDFVCAVSMRYEQLLGHPVFRNTDLGFLLWNYLLYIFIQSN